MLDTPGDVARFQVKHSLVTCRLEGSAADELGETKGVGVLFLFEGSRVAIKLCTLALQWRIKGLKLSVTASQLRCTRTGGVVYLGRNLRTMTSNSEIKTNAKLCSRREVMGLLRWDISRKHFLQHTKCAQREA